MFGIFPIIRVPGDALSRIVNDSAAVDYVEVPYVDLVKIINGYVDAQCFGPVVQALNGRWPGNTKKRLS